jgi:hypothetical protein
MSKFRHLSVCLALFLLAGCVSAPLKPEAGAVARVNSIHIVPMEPLPLTIEAGYAATGSTSLVHFLPRYTIGMARAVGVLSGVAVLLELASGSYQQPVYPPVVEPVETWLPTVELAQYAAQRLSASGRHVVVSPAIQPVPGVEYRGRTFLMENWMAPIRAWYNDETPSSRYAAFAGKGVDMIAEVGISNYEIFTGKLLLQVHIKLIDPASGRLLGRARASSFNALPSMDVLFADEAKIFRASVSAQGGQLVTTSLEQLGLLATR